MNKRIIAIVLMALIAGNLAACGGSRQTEALIEAETVPEETAPEEAADAAIVSETDEAIPTEDTETEEEAEAEEEEALNEGEEADVFAENNGSYFVRIGDDVWFRHQQPNVVNRISYGGLTFLEDAPIETTAADGPPASICRFNLKDGRYYDDIQDSSRGFGPLFYADDKLYSMRAKGEYGVMVYRMNLDGSGIETVCDGGIVDVTEDGMLIISPESASGYDLYKDAELIASYEIDYGWVAYCGSVGDEVFFLYSEGDEDCYLHELSPDGTVIRLGRLSGAPTECQDFVYDDGKVYLLFARREGTAAGVGERIVAKAVPGREGSVEVLPAEDMAFPDDGNAWILLTGDMDEVMIVPHRAGELGLSEGTWGDLVLYDSPYSAERLIADYLPDDPYAIEDSGTEIRFVQSLAYIKGIAFISSAVANRAPEYDIGWRMAYRLKYFSTDFLKVFDYSTGEQLVHDGDGELLKYGL